MTELPEWEAPRRNTAAYMAFLTSNSKIPNCDARSWGFILGQILRSTWIFGNLRTRRGEAHRCSFAASTVAVRVPNLLWGNHR